MMSNTPKTEQAASNPLANPESWEPIEIPRSLSEGLGIWAIRECNLLHLMSVWIGATYTSVSDAAIRTGLPVRPIKTGTPLLSPESWDTTGIPHSQNSYFGLWAIQEANLLKLMSVRLHSECISVADASEKSGILVRPICTDVSITLS